jgi:hypothetical protein
MFFHVELMSRNPVNRVINVPALLTRCWMPTENSWTALPPIHREWTGNRGKLTVSQTLSYLSM